MLITIQEKTARNMSFIGNLMLLLTSEIETQQVHGIVLTEIDSGPFNTFAFLT